MSYLESVESIPTKICFVQRITMNDEIIFSSSELLIAGMLVIKYLIEYSII